MLEDEEIEIMARAMQNSKAWPVVFQSGAARELARAAVEALRRERIDRSDRLEQDQTNFRSRT